jgi:hypothetical protein
MFGPEMDAGDRMYIRLEEGALKGGGNHAFTSFVGMMVANGQATF